MVLRFLVPGFFSLWLILGLSLRRVCILQSEATDVKRDLYGDQPLSAELYPPSCLPSPQPPCLCTPCPAGAAYCCIKGCANWDCQVCKKFPGMTVTEIHSTKHNGEPTDFEACSLTLQSLKSERLISVFESLSSSG
jgi:hypothetical protein